VNPGQGPVRPARVVFLGTGTSAGVPFIGCDCATCTSDDPKDRRLRPSVLVDVEGGPRLLVDTSTDLRQQALTHRIDRVDAVLFTHAHADHIFGLDDTRAFTFRSGRPLPCYAAPDTWQGLRQAFGYAFIEHTQGGGVPRLEPHEIDGPFAVGGVRVVPVPLWHGKLPILGFRFGNVAYLTDCNGLPETSWPLVEGVDTLVIDALRRRPHSSHFSLDEALAAVARIRPRRAFLTHINHDLPHAVTNAELPPGVELAWDGLVLDTLVEAA
jgi:phosphoribosyl 1,2-cyclic phosphate phosphodiesterase